MCGILGLIHKHAKNRQPLSVVDLSRLAHRGPDGHGTYANDHIQFGHTRLSIIDLTHAGDQPMASIDHRYIVTFNGEIYNYLELKAQLEGLGFEFKSHSDTEVLLASYQAWGQACVSRFIGMFAFVIWDNQDKTAFLGRDRCGEKPLFYHFSPDRLIFASELKALVPLLDTIPDLNPSSVDMYLHYQYVPEPYTLLKGVHKLPAGHTLTFSTENWQCKPKQYWCVETAKSAIADSLSQGEIESSIRDGLENAIKMTLRSDVPVGIALSGGIDSGAIAVLAQKNYPTPMHAFCVGYPGRPKYDERQLARSLAESLGMIVHEVELPVDSFVEFFPDLVRIMDEPIADPAAFGHYSVPHAASEQGIKVLLSGIGGDEIFWGYQWVSNALALNELSYTHPWVKVLASCGSVDIAQKFLTKVANYPHAHSALRRIADTLQKIGDPRNSDKQLLFYMLALDFKDAFGVKENVYGSRMRGLSLGNPYIPTDIGSRGYEQLPSAHIRMLFNTWLVSNCLSLGDRVSMGVGVETRMPFLDANLIELVMALREKTPDHKLGQKAWLRASLQGVLPEEVLKRPKAGFQPPVREWISGVVQRYVNMLRGGQLVKSQILSNEKIEFICNDLPKQDWIGLYFTYKLILLEMWYQKVVMQ